MKNSPSSEELADKVKEAFEFIKQRYDFDPCECECEDDGVELTALYRKIGHIEGMIHSAIKSVDTSKNVDESIKILTQILIYLAENF